jgi:citrate synthase
MKLRQVAIPKHGCPINWCQADAFQASVIAHFQMAIRAPLLAEALHKLGGARAQFAAEFERFALAALARHRPSRSLLPNLEIYAALLLEACGIPRNAFTPTFATARIAGWLAHSMEQQRTGRMLRPATSYIGPAPRP